jgi:putative DNA primase/helicase
VDRPRALDYQQRGLAAPPEVELETEEYRAEQDVLASFIADRCVEGPGLTVKSDPLYVAYKEWCQLNGEIQEAQNKFIIRLKEHGYEKSRNKHGKIWKGIGLRHDGDPAPDADPGTDPAPGLSPIDKPNGENVQRKGAGYNPISG